MVTSHVPPISRMVLHVTAQIDTIVAVLESQVVLTTVSIPILIYKNLTKTAKLATVVQGNIHFKTFCGISTQLAEYNCKLQQYVRS